MDIGAPAGNFHMSDTDATLVTEQTEFQKLMDEGTYLTVPKVGEVVKGRIISADRREVRIDIDGMTVGVIRGREIFSENKDYDGLGVGDAVEATVIDLENENGEMELSFRFAGQKRAWEELREMFTAGKIIDVKITEANKGGLIVRVNHVTGFLPVSQLSPDHYPRVTGGDKNKIFEKLKSYVGSSFAVKVIDANEGDEKLIVSEKSVWEDRQKSVIAQYRVGDTVEGEVTALADFGAFVRFGSLEGLVHISEIAWQRIDHPRDILKIGATVSAEIIGIEGSKIFLSMKKLVKDPWSDIQKRYKVGDTVEGTVLKINPFGFFVELDPEIHGLAHVSELSNIAGIDVNTLAKAGERMSFKIISIEPNEHRLGLSLKALSEKADAPVAEKTEEKKEEVVAEKVEEKSAE